MRRVITYIGLLILIFQLRGVITNAQPVNDSTLLNAPLYREKLQLFTDRNLYASGEAVRFRLYNLSHHLLKENSWSKVLYLELINSHNTPVARGKYPLMPEGASGQLMIPDTLTTGDYYLRAYTKWMRNFPSSDYYHFPLTVVNPQKIRMKNLVPGPADSIVKRNNSVPARGIICTSDKSGYGKRERVRLHVKRDSTFPVIDGYCISVTRKCYLDTDFSYIPENEMEDQVMKKEVVYYPETRGISVSGKVVRRRDGQAVGNSSISMTLLGSDPDYVAFVTDEKGRIHFPLPSHEGSGDAIITFNANRDEAIELMLHSQISKAFISTAGDSMPVDEIVSGHAFYGHPEYKYKTDDYVALPTLADFFFELIPQVLVKKHEDKRYFSVVDDKDVPLEYPPLILLRKSKPLTS